MTKSSHKSMRWALTPARLATVICLLGAAGCQQDLADSPNTAVLQPLKDNDVQVYARVDAVTGKVLPPIAMKRTESGELIHHGELLHARGDMAAHPEAPAGDFDGGAGPLPDYEAKSDAYWKFNAIRKSLLAGTIPPDLRRDLEADRRRILRTVPDGNYDLAMAAINHYERGFILLTTDQALQTAGVDLSLVPWAQGATEVTRYVNRHLLNHRPVLDFAASNDLSDDDAEGSDTPRAPQPRTVAPEKRAIADIIKLYTQRYRGSPQEGMVKEFQLAIIATNTLRDNLHLGGRPENSDGDRSDVSPSMSRSGINMPGRALSILDVKRALAQMASRDALGMADPGP